MVESGFSNRVDALGMTMCWELDELVRESLEEGKSITESSRKKNHQEKDQQENYDVLNCKCTILSSSIKDYRSHKDVNNKQILER